MDHKDLYLPLLSEIVIMQYQVVLTKLHAIIMQMLILMTEVVLMHSKGLIVKRIVYQVNF